MPLTSPQNQQLQNVRRAVQTGRPLDDGTIAAEGPHLLAEALAGDWSIEHLFFSTGAAQRHQPLLSQTSRRRIAITEVAERAFQTIAGTEQSQGLLALLRPPAFKWGRLLESSAPLIILDHLQDPGNAGTIIRSAEAFGACGIAFTEGCVRVSNGKLLRAAAGSLFRLPFLENLPAGEIMRQLAAGKRSLFSLTAQGQLSLVEADLKHPFALVVGSEGGGVSETFLKASQTLSIPTRRVESLNAAVACSIALFEAARQRGPA